MSGIISVLSLFCVLSLFSCNDSPVTQKISDSGYNLSKPDQRIILPDTLREISGLTMLDNENFACIQDENGIIFIGNLNTGNIEKQFVFGPDGDYEGIAKAGNDLYILRSDGTLFGISDYNSGNIVLNTWPTGIPANNNEGLCYDAANNRLLIACKGKSGKGAEFKDIRQIYAFSLETKTLSEEAIYNFNIKEIIKYAEKKGIKLAENKKKKGKHSGASVKFRPSAIGIHPVTKKLYLLSATDHMLFVFGRNGKIESIEQLDHKLFNKAEGISFLENGDMLITNEAQNKKASLLRFEYNAM